MKSTPNTLSRTTAMECAWNNCPWAAVAVNDAGVISAITPGFLNYCAMSEAALIGMSEGALNGLLLSIGVERHRVSIDSNGLRAIYYIRHFTPASASDLHLRAVAEKLREPLASIQGFAELLLTQQYDEATRRELTATLLAETEALSNIINRELDVTRRWP